MKNNIKLPENVIKREGCVKNAFGDDTTFTAYLVPVSGLKPLEDHEKLIGFYTNQTNWVHKDYLVKSVNKKKRK
jgi:hypothetical protein